MSVDAPSKFISSVEKQELLNCSFSYKFCHQFLSVSSVLLNSSLLQVKQHFDWTPGGKGGFLLPEEVVQHPDSW